MSIIFLRYKSQIYLEQDLCLKICILNHLRCNTFISYLLQMARASREIVFSLIETSETDFLQMISIYAVYDD